MLASVSLSLYWQVTFHRVSRLNFSDDIRTPQIRFCWEACATKWWTQCGFPLPVSGQIPNPQKWTFVDRAEPQCLLFGLWATSESGWSLGMRVICHVRWAMFRHSLCWLTEWEDSAHQAVLTAPFTVPPFSTHQKFSVGESTWLWLLRLDSLVSTSY